jgi:transposase-like protein
MRVQPSEQARMRELYKQPGSSLRTVAEALNRSPTTVRRHLETQGVILRPARRKRPPSFPPEVADRIVERYSHGEESLAALGKAYQASADRIRRLLEYRNVPIRPRGRPSAASRSRQRARQSTHRPRSRTAATSRAHAAGLDRQKPAPAA